VVRVTKKLKVLRTRFFFRCGIFVRCARVGLCLFFMAAFWAGTQSTVGYFSAQTQKPKQSGNPSQAAEHAPVNGRVLFESICAGCHGLDGRGAEKGPNIATRPSTVRRSDNDLLAILQNGIPAAGMPSFNALGPAKLKSLIDHLRTLQGLDQKFSLTGDPLKGKELFFKQGSCAACHAIDGAGGFLGSDLSTDGAITFPDELREEIQNHDQLPRANAIEVATRDGRTLTGIVRNEDNFSLQLQTLDGNFHFLDKQAIANFHYAQSSSSAKPNRLLNEKDLDALVSYLVNVAQSSKDAQKLQRHSKHHEEDEDD